jgi:hypothetical protein
MNGQPEDVALVLPVLPLIAHFPRSARWLSIREAEAVAPIRRAAPGLPAAAAATLAVLYAERERQRKSTADLDLYLAAGPWQWQGEGVDEWTWKEGRYIRLAEAAGVPAIAVSPLGPGDVVIGVTGIVTVRPRLPDGSWGRYAREKTTDEWDEEALDWIAQE